jgi:hypothetical protein
VACGFIGREMLRAVRIAGCLRAGCEYPTRIHLPNFPKNEKKSGGENIITLGFNTMTLLVGPCRFS